jgi:Domain of unknown function (DUF929)
MSKSNPGPTRPTSSRPSKGAATTRSALRRTKSSGRQAPARTSFRTRHPVVAALVPVGLVVAVIATMVVIKATGGSAAPSSSPLQADGANRAGQTETAALSSTVLAELAVPAAILDAIGSPRSDSLPGAISGTPVLKGQDGKPLITYVGAEYCPYCAAERWALAVALSRFGSFSHLSATHSAGTDVYPNTQTLSFYASSYSSPFVDFQAVEEATNQVVNGSYQTLQTPTAAQRALMAKYDSSGSIPFLDIANKYVVTGASFSPQVLQGLSREQIAAQLSDPSSPVALAIDGTANDITAAICNVTGNLPSSVGNSSAIAAIAKTLGA